MATPTTVLDAQMVREAQCWRYLMDAYHALHKRSTSAVRMHVRASDDEVLDSVVRLMRRQADSGEPMVQPAQHEQPTLHVPVYVTSPDQLPAAATAGSAGLDLRAAEPGSLQPGERRLVPTGLRLALPPGWEAQVRPRSGLAMRHGVTVLNSPGTVDADYRGDVGVLLVNLGSKPWAWGLGDRVAQLVVQRVPSVQLVPVPSPDDLDSTQRGEGGFGSTGGAQ